jgi:predicted Zn-dependent peptidase
LSSGKKLLIRLAQKAPFPFVCVRFSCFVYKILKNHNNRLPQLSPQRTKATAASVTTLANIGLTIVTEAACTTSTVTMTYPKAGSAEEMLDEQGAALINKCLAFKSGSGMSTLVINRTIENAGSGGIPFATANRRGATLGFTVSPDQATALLPLLAIDCSFEKWDMRDAKKVASVICEDAATSAQIVLTENLFAAAYGAQSAAGRTFYEYSGTPSDLVKSFRARAYGLNGAILTATGVSDHAAFCTEAAELLAAAPAGPSSAASASPIVYMGGESRVAASSGGYAHVALAFEAPASSVVANVIKHALSLTGASSGVDGFATTGLVGVYSGSDETSGIVDAMSAVLTTKFTPDLLKRAKRAAKAEALFALDGGSKMLAQCMTAGVLETDSFAGPAAIAKAYDAVSEKDLSSAITAMLKTNPSLAAIGDISLVPYHANVAGRFA